MVRMFINNNLFNKINRFKILLFLATGSLIISCAKGQDHLSNENWLQLEKAAENSTVVLNNTAGTLPIISLSGVKIASIDLGFNHSATFDSLLNKYHSIESFNTGKYFAKGSLNPLLDDVKLFNTLILEVSDVSILNPQVVNFILDAEKKYRVIIALFGSGKSLIKLDAVRSAVIWCEHHTPQSASFVAQAIFGGVSVKNVLKETYSDKFLAGSGTSVPKIRLKYTVPEYLGIKVGDLQKIDRIADEAIRERATPGAVVMVIKDGSVIYNKAYGSPTYANERPVKITDIYDIASVTKTSATTPVVMQLVESGKLNLDDPLKTYIASTTNTDKQDIKVREVMLHQAGFVPYIPFYQKLTVADYRRDSSAGFPTKVADNYFLRKNYYRDIMWPQMLNSKLTSRGNYVYSDLSMYYMKEIVETVTHKSLDQYVSDQFYEPLGMQTAGFNPRNRFDRDNIIPTEEDTYFRKTLLQGYVHDQGAAMAGGVSGHAGLFASANDLGILYQMLLNRGKYGGKSYFKPETVDMFTAKQSGVSRRGLGFDRWDPELSKHYPSEFASPATFGHTGYTGTCVWADPQYNLVYVFLSNRVYPQVTDKLSHLSIRPRIQDAIYDAIKKASK